MKEYKLKEKEINTMLNINDIEIKKITSKNDFISDLIDIS